MKVLGIDGNSILNRAFYGVKPLSNHKGVFTNAIFGFFNIVLKALSEEQPDAVAFAFDLKAPTFRHKTVATYKANRKGMPEELAMQLPLTQEILRAMGYAVVTAEGWEADDILGTLARLCTEHAADCVLLTGDRDNLQLINEHVTVRLATNRETLQYDTAKFTEEYGFAPIRLIDLKALMGDSSDNISGVPGIGEKTALKFVRAYDTIEALYAALPTATLTPSERRKLEAGEAAAKESKWLATIVTDAPIEQELTAYLPKAQDTEKLSAILTDLELYRLMERLELTPAAITEATAESVQAIAYTVGTLDETGLETLCSKQTAVAFLYQDNLLYLADDTMLYRVTNPAWIDRFFTSDVPKITWDAKPVYRHCMAAGDTLHHLQVDALIDAYLLNPSIPEYSLSRSCAEMQIGEDTALGDYAAIAALPQLAERLEQEIDAQGMRQLLDAIELPLVEVLADMEIIGVRVDAQGVASFGQMLSERIAEVEQDIYNQVGHTFNILSPKQLGVVLFEELGLPAGKKTKTGWSTNAEVLEGLRHRHPVVEQVLQYRQLTKLNSTYVEGLTKAVAPDGRIHTCYRQTETRTGRLSSTEPNLQNIPVRTPLGREMRKFFIAAEGKTLVDADYSQIELRLVAHLCGDANMQQSFVEQRDIHRMTAAQVFGLPEEMITKEMRSAAKAVNFGILYGISAFSLSKDIGVTVTQADRYIKDYLHSFPNVEWFMKDTVAQAKEMGYVTTLFGRKRYVPELKASNKVVQAAGKRIAMNTPVQGTAADIMKAAMVRVWRRLREELPSAKLILQIHDELIVEAPQADAEAAANILKAEMEAAYRLSVPLEVEVATGESWYDAKG